MEDVLQLTDLFTDEEKAIQQSVRQVVQTQILPQIANCFEHAHFEPQWPKLCADLGILGMTLPTRLGGLGASYTAYGLVCQELEAVDSALRSFASVQSALVMQAIAQYGSVSQQQQYLASLAKAQCIGAFGLTEPDVGSDPGSMTTRAVKTDKGYVLTGTKTWITNAPIAHMAVIWAKEAGQICGFLVPLDLPGVTVMPLEHKLALRASSTGMIILENCQIPLDHKLPGAVKGLSSALACLSIARFGIAWGALGAAEACLTCALDYVKNRKQFGHSLARYQLVQATLADLYAELLQARLMNWRVAQLMDAGQINHVAISLIKRTACRVALSVARRTRDLLGANGISLEYPIIRHLANLEAVVTYEGTDTMHTLILGKYLTGLAAFGLEP